jgi:hypothetical protein
VFKWTCSRLTGEVKHYFKWTVSALIGTYRIQVYNLAMTRRQVVLFTSLIIGFLGSSVVVAQKAVERPGSEIHGILLSADNDSFMLRGVMILPAGPSKKEVPVWVPLPGKTKVVDAVGTFDIKGVMPGRYFFSPEGPQAAVTYFKHIECRGLDYSARPLEIDAGEIAINCNLTFARDSGTITGQVLRDGAPVRAYQVVAVPEPKELRSVASRWAISWPPTRSNGRFEMQGVIPGNYLVVAVPVDVVKSHFFALDFDDKIYASAQHLMIASNETATIALEPTSAK